MSRKLIYVQLITREITVKRRNVDGNSADFTTVILSNSPINAAPEDRAAWNVGIDRQ